MKERRCSTQLFFPFHGASSKQCFRKCVCRELPACIETTFQSWQRTFVLDLNNDSFCALPRVIFIYENSGFHDSRELISKRAILKFLLNERVNNAVGRESCRIVFRRWNLDSCRARSLTKTLCILYAFVYFARRVHERGRTKM